MRESHIPNLHDLNVSLKYASKHNENQLCNCFSIIIYFLLKPISTSHCRVFLVSPFLLEKLKICWNGEAGKKSSESSSIQSLLKMLTQHDSLTAAGINVCLVKDIDMRFSVLRGILKKDFNLWLWVLYLIGLYTLPLCNWSKAWYNYDCQKATASWTVMK